MAKGRQVGESSTNLPIEGLIAVRGAPTGGDSFPEITIQLAAYRPHRSNYNQHGVLQIEKLRASLRKFGQPRNVVVWRDFFVAGHGVAQAAMSAIV